MTKTVNAAFDGDVFRPDERVALPPNTKVRLTIETTEPESKKTASFLDTAASLNLRGPSDWSSRLEGYLYGGKSNEDEMKRIDDETV